MSKVFRIAQGLEHLHARDQVHAGLKQVRAPTTRGYQHGPHNQIRRTPRPTPTATQSSRKWDCPYFLDENRLGSYGDPDDVRRAAPDVLAGGTFSSASGVYSFGCLILGASPLAVIHTGAHVLGQR